MIALLALTLLAADLDPILEICRPAGGRVGVAAAVLGGDPILEAHARDRFPMQSVYKLPIAMAVLAEVDRHKLDLDRIVHVDPREYISPAQHSPLRDRHPVGANVTLTELLRLAVSESDGTASDVLLRLAGGPGAVMNHLRAIGVTGMMVRDTEMRLGQDWKLQYANWTTPAAAVALLRALDASRGLSASSRVLLLKFMTESATSQTRIKGLLPPGTIAAHKTGSLGTRNGVSAATRDRVIARLARLAWDRALR